MPVKEKRDSLRGTEKPLASSTVPARRSHRSRSREGHLISSKNDRDRSTSADYRQSKKVDPEGKHASTPRRQSDQCLGRRELPTAKSEERDRSNGRGTSKSKDMKDVNGTCCFNDRKETRVALKRSKSVDLAPREGSRSIGRSPGETNQSRTDVGDDHNNSSSILKPSLRERRVSDIERSKRFYCQSPTYSNLKSKGDKHRSNERKSSVLASLDSFLEKGEVSMQSKSTDERSILSSASKIQRRKSKSAPPSGASLFGGQVIRGRDEVRERRRSRSSSQGPLDETDKISEKRSDARKERQLSTARSRTPSARTRSNVKRTSIADSEDKPTSSTPVVERQHNVALKSGADVPPGPPTLALVDMKGVTITRRHSSGHSAVLGDATKMVDRQRHTHIGVVERDGSSRSMSAVERLSSLRREQRLHESSPHLGPNPKEGTVGAVDPSSCLTRPGRSPGHSRSKRSGEGVMSVPSLSGKDGKRSSSRKGAKNIATLRLDPEPRSPSQREGQQGKEDFVEGGEGPHKSGDDFHESSASLDPSVLTKESGPYKKITSVDELYHNSAGNYEHTEGEIELNDSSMHMTQGSLSGSHRVSCGSPVILFDSVQLQQHPRPIGLEPISPHSSSHSGTGESLRSACIIKRQVSEVVAGTPTVRRISWVELPLASPAMVLVKSTDDDGNNERESMASFGSCVSLEDLSGESKLCDAVRCAEKIKNEENSVSKNSPSLGATLEKQARKKRHSADERTVGTTTTSTSESTLKIENKSGTARVSRKSKTQESDRKVSRRNSSSLKTSVSSSRPHVSPNEESFDGSTTIISRKAPQHDDGTVTERKLLKRRSSGGKVKSSCSDIKTEEDASSMKEKPMRRRGSSSSTVNSPKAGSRIRYIKSSEDQSTGEPTAQLSPPGSSLTSAQHQSIPANSTKSNRSRHNMIEESKEEAQSPTPPVVNKLGNFLERMAATSRTDDRSVKSEGLLKKRAKSFLARMRTSTDENSVASAPMLTSRRKRRVSTKVKPGIAVAGVC